MRAQASHLKSIPGDAGPFPFGYTRRFLKEPLKILRERYDRYGEISWCNAYGSRIVYMIGPDANQYVVENRENSLSNEHGWGHFLGKFFNRGVMLLDFEEHRWHRRILQKAFKREALENYLSMMDETIQEALRQWSAGDGFLLRPAIKKLTLDLATKAFMGEALGAKAERVTGAFIATVNGSTSLVRFPLPGNRWSRGLKGREVLEAYFREKVPAKRHGDGADMFSELCRATSETGEQFSDEDVVNHMIFLIMSAHDTTASTLMTMMYHLAKQPEWQARIRSQCARLGGTPLTIASLDALSDVELCMKESLRLCAPVTGLPRRAIADCNYKDYFIPKGTMLMATPFFMGHMKEYWPQPERFDPERFAEPRRDDRIHRYAWMPFGGGVHKCIGLHLAEVTIKVILLRLTQQFRWSVPQDYTLPMNLIAIPTPADGLPVRLEPAVAPSQPEQAANAPSLLSAAN